jgi:hypothetical protein
MSAEFSVRTQEVTAHATRVDTIADGVQPAADAGAAVQTRSDAYGQLCAMVPAVLNDLQSTLVSALQATARNQHELAGDLRDTAADRAFIFSA